MCDSPWGVMDKLFKEVLRLVFRIRPVIPHAHLMVALAYNTPLDFCGRSEQVRQVGCEFCFISSYLRGVMIMMGFVSKAASLWCCLVLTEYSSAVLLFPVWGEGF